MCDQQQSETVLLPDRTARQKLFYRALFESDTWLGKITDIVLLICIILSTAIVMLDSVASFQYLYGSYFDFFDWVFTFIFTFEYIARLYCVQNAKVYAGSFYGIIDLAAILPAFISLIIPEVRFLQVFKLVRVLRVFRIFKLAHFIREADMLCASLWASKDRIIVFFIGVLMLVTMIGTMIYIIEGEENGFTSIPLSIYWAVVTLTTVGYGDIAPKTAVGQIFSVIIMLLGYSIIAVPTGIVTAEMISSRREKNSSDKKCPVCKTEGHSADAVYCKDCGAKL